MTKHEILEGFRFWQDLLPKVDPETDPWGLERARRSFSLRIGLWVGLLELEPFASGEEWAHVRHEYAKGRMQAVMELSGAWIDAVCAELTRQIEAEAVPSVTDEPVAPRKRGSR